MTEFAPYQAAHDFEDLKDFLDLDEPGFQVPFEAPVFQPEFATAIVVDNLPCAPMEKMPKMKTILADIYLQISKGLTVEDIHMPVDDATRATLGFCFIKCKTMAEAKTAVEITNGSMFGKKNQMRVSLYAELQKLSDLSEEYSGFTKSPFNPRPDPTSWLTDKICRDQFVIRHGKETEVFWGPVANDEEPDMAFDGQRQKKEKGSWCESYVTWSPNGTYLATFHNNGILLWGGEDFKEGGRFFHEGVEEIAFSPCENYMVTYRIYDNQPYKTPAVIVWSIVKGQMLRSFDVKSSLDPKFQVEATVTEDKSLGKSKFTGEDKGSKKVDRVMRGRVVNFHANCFTIREDTGAEHVIGQDLVRPLQDPNHMKWSPDGKYLAKIGVDVITVYQLPEMTILDRKSIAAPNVLDFQWSPNSNYISYYVPASGPRPALINIIEIPTRKDVCSRKAFDVISGRMSWHPDGDFLGAFMTKLTGKNKSYVLLFFRINEPGVPVEMIELKEPVYHMAWEPKGERLSIVHGDQGKPSVSFYSMGMVPKTKDQVGRSKRELHLLYTLTEKKCTEVMWSPAGNTAIILSYASDGAAFEFHDVSANVTVATRRHDKCKRVVWDPSGRVLASCTIRNINDPSRSTLDDGYHLFTFQGIPIAQIRKERLHQFQWRPRPRNLFAPSERKKIIKELRKYERIFGEEDKQRKNESLEAVIEGRRSQATDYLVLLGKKRALYAQYKEQRKALRDGFDSEDDEYYEIKTEVVEHVIGKKKH